MSSHEAPINDYFADDRLGPPPEDEIDEEEYEMDLWDDEIEDDALRESKDDDRAEQSRETWGDEND